MTAPSGGIPPNVVIDNSVILPILKSPYRHPNWLVLLWQARRIKPLVSDETVQELAEKLLENSPTTREYPPQRFVDNALRVYLPWSDNIALQDNPLNLKCTDPKDQMFVDLAIAGNADFIVTEDNAPLSMAPLLPSVRITDRIGFRRHFS